MSNIVKEWYETKENVDAMVHWEKGKLKKWELAVSKFFPAKARILDIGCGLGREAFALSDMGFKVTGIDISQEVIKQVTSYSVQKGYDIPFCVYDGYKLPFKEDSFDVIIIWSQTFGLIYGNEYKQEFLLESKRVLRSGGLLSFSVHDYRLLAEKYKNFLKDRKFYPYADSDICWETFEPIELSSFANGAEYTVILCEKGEIYTPEDGTILHCLCRK